MKRCLLFLLGGVCVAAEKGCRNFWVRFSRRYLILKADYAAQAVRSTQSYLSVRLLTLSWLKLNGVALRLRILIGNYFLLTRIQARLDLQKRRLRGRQLLSSPKTKIIFADAHFSSALIGFNYIFRTIIFGKVFPLAAGRRERVSVEESQRIETRGEDQTRRR